MIVRITEKHKKDFKLLFHYLTVFLFTLLIGLFLFNYLILFVIVPSGSMENTIPTNSLAIASTLPYIGDFSPKRGDVVLFTRTDFKDKKQYVKRIIGIPNDKIEIINGITFINDEKFTESWLKEMPEMLNFGPFVLTEKQYFCMGDNRNNSYDCRYWKEHFVLEDNIQAKIFAYYNVELNTFSFDLKELK